MTCLVSLPYRDIVLAFLELPESARLYSIRVMGFRIYLWWYLVDNVLGAGLNVLGSGRLDVCMKRPFMRRTVS